MITVVVPLDFAFWAITATGIPDKSWWIYHTWYGYTKHFEYFILYGISNLYMIEIWIYYYPCARRNSLSPWLYLAKKVPGFDDTKNCKYMYFAKDKFQRCKSGEPGRQRIRAILPHPRALCYSLAKKAFLSYF